MRLGKGDPPPAPMEGIPSTPRVDGMKLGKGNTPPAPTVGGSQPCPASSPSSKTRKVLWEEAGPAARQLERLVWSGSAARGVAEGVTPGPAPAPPYPASRRAGRGKNSRGGDGLGLPGPWRQERPQMMMRDRTAPGGDSKPTPKEGSVSPWRGKGSQNLPPWKKTPKKSTISLWVRASTEQRVRAAAPAPRPPRWGWESRCRVPGESWGWRARGTGGDVERPRSRSPGRGEEIKVH